MTQSLDNSMLEWEFDAVDADGARSTIKLRVVLPDEFFRNFRANRKPPQSPDQKE